MSFYIPGMEGIGEGARRRLSGAPLAAQQAAGASGTVQVPGVVPERTPAHSDEERARIQQDIADTRHKQALGYSLASQGYSDAPEKGASLYAQDRFRGTYGAFADPTWDVRVVNGVLQYKAKPNQGGRIAAGGGVWHAADADAQRGFERAQANPAEYGSQRAMQTHLRYLLSKGYINEGGIVHLPGQLSDAYDARTGEHIGTWGNAHGFKAEDGHTGPSVPGVPGSGGPGGTGGIPGMSGVSADPSKASDYLWQQLVQNLNGGGAYNPSVFEEMKGQIKSAAEGSASAARDQALQQAALSGTFRSAATGRSIGDINRAGASAYSGGVTNLVIDRAKQQAQQRMDTLGKMQDWLNSYRDNALRRESNAIERSKIDAQIKLAQMNIDAEKQSLQTQIEGNLGGILLQAGIGGL